MVDEVYGAAPRPSSVVPRGSAQPIDALPRGACTSLRLRWVVRRRARPSMPWRRPRPFRHETDRTAATRENPATAGLPEARPRGFEPLTFGSVEGGPSGPLCRAFIENSLQSKGFRRGHERTARAMRRRDLLPPCPTSVPTEARIGPARALPRAVCGRGWRARTRGTRRGRTCGCVQRLSHRPRIPDGYAKTGGNHNPRVGGSSPFSAIKAKPSTRVLALERRDAPPQVLPVIDAIKQLCSRSRWGVAAAQRRSLARLACCSTHGTGDTLCSGRSCYGGPGRGGRLDAGAPV